MRWLGFVLLLFTGFSRAEDGVGQVWRAHDPFAVQGFNENPELIRAMVEGLVCGISGKKDPAAGWRTFFSKDDKVLILVAGGGPKMTAAHPAIVDAVVAGVVSAGVPRKNIIQTTGASRKTDFSKENPFISPVPGRVIFGDLEFKGEKEQTSQASHWSKVFAPDVTKIVNVAVFRTVSGVGIGGALYNATIPHIDNWRRFVGAPVFGDPYIPQLYSDPRLSGKVVLHFMDGLMAQFAGGPERQPNYAWDHATLYASRDPVALDTVALREIEAWRKLAKLPELGREAAHVAIAGVMGLGCAEMTEIQVRDVR